MRKISKIRSVNSSYAIEANILTEYEVAALIQGNTVLAPRHEIIEIKNAFDVYDNISEFSPYDVEFLLQAHYRLTKDLIFESGRFRSNHVGVFEYERVIHMRARPDFVAGLVEELLTWGKESDVHPIMKSCIIHFELEVIYPFADGNGGIGRLWQSLILFLYNTLFEYLPIETAVYEFQAQYYQAISESITEGTSTKFIEFMLEMILKTIDKFDLEI